MIAEDYGITCDLMKKAGADVSGALNRVASIAPEPLPVAMAGGAAALGVIAGILSQMAGDYEASKPDPNNILLAALLCAHTGIGAGGDGISRAYQDFEKLKGQP